MKYLYSILLLGFIVTFPGCIGPYHPYPSSVPAITDSLKRNSTSLSRFSIVGNTLCCVSNSSIKTYNIQNPGSPVYLSSNNMSNSILSLRPLRNNELISGDKNGLSINKITTSGIISQIGAISSSQYYDPYIFIGDSLFLVQTRTSYQANAYPDILFVYNAASLSVPKIAYSNLLHYPKDISCDSSNHLFVCDSGLKVFDASIASKISLISHFKSDANRVLAYNDNLFIMGNTGLFQYRYTAGSLNLISKINIVPVP